MNTTNTLYTVLAIVVLCFIALFLLAPTTEDIPYTVLDDSSIESHITKSYLDNGNLIIDIYNPNCEIVKVKPATIEHHVTASMDSVKIFNYTDQYFEVIVGNASDVYTFGNLTKTWDAKNKTVIIGTADGEPLLTIERVSINPDLCTFEEVLNITSYVDYELNNLKDFRSRWRQYKGTNNITGVDWYIQKNQSYNVVVPEYGLIEQSQIIPNIIEYEDVTTTWMCSDCALGTCNSSQYWNISRSTANGTESGTICFDSYEVLQANPLKIKIYWNETGVIGSHNETNYYNVWKQFSPVGKTIYTGQSYIIKVVYHKKPELGDVRIQTIPLFRGVECDELTWWNTSWDNKREIKIDNTGGSALTYYQVNIDLSSTPINSTSLRVVNETADATIPHWQEVISSANCTDLWFNVTSIPASAWLNETYYIYYINNDATLSSSGSDTFIQWHGVATTEYSDPTVISSNFIYEAKGKSTASTHDLRFGVKNAGTYDDSVNLESHTGNNLVYLSSYNEGSATTLSSESPSISLDTFMHFKITNDDTTQHGYVDDNEIGSGGTGSLPDENMGMFILQALGTSEQEWSFIRKYTATEPTATLGAEEDSFSITSYAPSTPLNKLESESQYFNVTTDSNCQCRWYINGTLKQTNNTQQTKHNYTNTSLELGYYNFSAVVNTSSGATDMQTWWVTVTVPPAIPPDPTNLTNTTGNFWIKHAWDVGAGNITDEYAVNVNGSWYNTSNAYINLSKPPRGYQNITVQAWNSSGVGTLSAGTLSDNVSLPNNPIYITNYSATYEIYEFDTITIDFDYTDADGDTPTFATDSPSGSLNSGTGVWSWTTINDEGIYQWTFNVTDGYGSVAEASPYVTVLPDFGYNHGGADWTPTDGGLYDLDAGVGSIVIAGYHWNIDTFTITDGTSVSIKSYDDAGEYGYVKIEAIDIIVNGTLTGNSSGYSGSNGGTCGGSSGQAGYLGTYGGVGGSGGGGGIGKYTATSYSCSGPFNNGKNGGDGASASASTYGTHNQMDINMGYGAGGAGSGGGDCTAPEECIYGNMETSGTSGNRGGGIIYFDAGDIQINGIVCSNGGVGGTGGTGASIAYYAGGAYCDNCYHMTIGGGGGGGVGAAGGGILMIGNDILVTGALTVEGGTGSAGGLGENNGANGSDGGGGRIKLFYRTSIITTGSTLSALGYTNGTIYMGELYTYVNITGIVYNASSALPLPNASVSFLQTSMYYNTTSDVSGNYQIEGLLPNVPIYVSATKAGYTHENFNVTPLWADNYTVDLYMMPEVTGVHGLVIDYPWHQAIYGSTVRLWNATYNTSTTTNQAGYYIITDVNDNEYTMNASATDYTTSDNVNTTVVDNVSTQIFVLTTQYNLTVKAIDSISGIDLTSFVATVESETITTTNGSAIFNLDYGLYYVEVAKDGYYPGYTYAYLDEDQTVTVSMTEIVTDYYDPSHYVSFIVQSITGTLYAGVTTSVYNAADSSGTAIYSDVTGSDGVVGFELNETTLYRITFVDVAQGIDEEFTLYPIDTEYVVIVSSSISFDPGTPDTNLTNTTIQYTNQSWSIQNLTGDYLSTTLGISHTGQGVIAATICWATASVACGAPTLVVLGILAHLGIISWVMVLFTGMTMLSIYILGGKIG